MKDTATPTKKEGTPAQVMVDAYSKLVNLEGEQNFISLYGLYSQDIKQQD